jgi:hypothetical protein
MTMPLFGSGQRPDDPPPPDPTPAVSGGQTGGAGNVQQNVGAVEAGGALIGQQVNNPTYLTVTPEQAGQILYRSGGLSAALIAEPDDAPEKPRQLFGRDTLVAAMNALLDNGERVLLHGFGGMGKTALR